MKRILTLIVTFFALAASAAANTYTIDPAHSDVSFKIRHLVSRTAGRFADFSGTITADFQNLDASSVEFTIVAASIDTRSEDRDKHLRSPDFFDTEKFKEITFTSHKITRAGEDSYAVTGNLTMHGVTREITLPVKYLGEVKDPWGNLKAGFELAVTVDRKDFGISWNKALDAGGLILGDDVEISISLEVAKQ